MNETVEEIARRSDEAIERGTEAEGLVPIKARVKKNADVVYSTRFSRDEIAAIRRAAEALGLAPTAFIRRAALAAAAGTLNLSTAARLAAVDEVKARARDLAEAASKL